MRSASLFRLIFAPANFKSSNQRKLQLKHKRFTQRQPKAFLPYAAVATCCVVCAPAEKRRIMDMEICSWAITGETFVLLGRGGCMRCAAAVCVCSIYSPAERQQRDHIILLEIHSALAHPCSQRAETVARFIIPCRAATAKNSWENEFTECVCLCVKNTRRIDALASTRERVWERESKHPSFSFRLYAAIWSIEHINNILG